MTALTSTPAAQKPAALDIEKFTVEVTRVTIDRTIHPSYPWRNSLIDAPTLRYHVGRSFVSAISGAFIKASQLS